MVTIACPWGKIESSFLAGLTQFGLLNPKVTNHQAIWSIEGDLNFLAKQALDFEVSSFASLYRFVFVNSIPRFQDANLIVLAVAFLASFYLV